MTSAEPAALVSRFTPVVPGPRKLTRYGQPHDTFGFNDGKT